MASFQGTLESMSNNRDPQELSEYCEDLDVWGFYMEHARTPAASVVSRYQSSQDAKDAGDRALVGAMAACFHIRPIESSYVWQGSVTEAQEWELDLITVPDAARELFEELLKSHPYKLPHVSASTIEVSKEYALWVSECVSRDV
jgi:uncharacterized protein involved in tolerance to divalent cations